MGKSVPLPDGIRPHVRVKHRKTGQFGRVADQLSRATKWAIMVHVEKSTGGVSGTTVLWKIKDLEVLK